MAFATSRDGGRTFSAPVRVSEDGWAIDACPDDGPAMAVDASGTVHLAWPTVLGGDNPRGAIFYASTRDGQRFTPRQQVATLGGPKPSHPQIVVDGRRRVFVAWDELTAGKQTAAFAKCASTRAAPQRSAASSRSPPVNRASTLRLRHPATACWRPGLRAGIAPRSRSAPSRCRRPRLAVQTSSPSRLAATFLRALMTA